MFSTMNRYPLGLLDMYKNMPVFLLCGGPSLKDYDLSLLDSPGIYTMGVNNVPAIYRTDLWVAGDPPTNFLLSIWKDPKIMKFTPYWSDNTLLWDSSIKDVSKDFLIADAPNVVYYKHSVQHLNPNNWLAEPFFTWGLSSRSKYYSKTLGRSFQGSRSTFLIALKILITLGFRRIYLLGVDFKMSENKPYAFGGSHRKDVVAYNNKLYDMVQAFLLDMSPYFEAINLQIFNCYKDSGLKLYSYISYEEALKDNNLSDLISKESTNHSYDPLEKKAKDNGVDLTPYIVKTTKTKSDNSN